MVLLEDAQQKKLEETPEMTAEDVVTGEGSGGRGETGPCWAEQRPRRESSPGRPCSLQPSSPGQSAKRSMATHTERKYKQAL